MFGLYFLDGMLFLEPSFSHLICYINYIFVNSMALFKLKKENLVHIVLVKYIWVNNCFVSF